MCFRGWWFEGLIIVVPGGWLSSISFSSVALPWHRVHRRLLWALCPEFAQFPGSGDWYWPWDWGYFPLHVGAVWCSSDGCGIPSKVASVINRNNEIQMNLIAQHWFAFLFWAHLHQWHAPGTFLASLNSPPPPGALVKSTRWFSAEEPGAKRI